MITYPEDFIRCDSRPGQRWPDLEPEPETFAYACTECGLVVHLTAQEVERLKRLLRRRTISRAHRVTRCVACQGPLRALVCGHCGRSFRSLAGVRLHEEEHEQVRHAETRRRGEKAKE